MDIPKLKCPEPEILDNDLWNGDLLKRNVFADSLTKLIENEQAPLVLSVNGDWGSGKTFVLKRWKRQLEKQGFRAIYFNAWEEDFVEDPIIAILGQLWLELKDGDLVEMAKSLKKNLKPFFVKSTLNAVKTLSRGFADVDKKDLQSIAEKVIDNYADMHSCKNDLKSRLGVMARKIYEQSKHPLVFIIDELDRCRPTFSIELLERVKHIFDIPHVVFVFGIDRNQLYSSIQAVYGDIDVVNYLHRFFDMDFLLPTNDRKHFCQRLLDRHGLKEYFFDKSGSAGNQVHTQDYNDFESFFPELCEGFKFSLREIEHCIRSFVFVSRNIEDKCYLFPLYVSIFWAVKLKNNNLYRRYLFGDCGVAEIMNYVSRHLENSSWFDRLADRIEIMFYLLECDLRHESDPICQQLELLSIGDKLTMPELLSERIRNLDKKSLEEFLGRYKELRSQCDLPNSQIATKHTLKFIFSKIELSEMVANYN